MSDRIPQIPLTIKQGETRTFTLTVMDNNEDPVDLTGYTAKLQIREKPGGTLISEITSTSGITINAASGTITPLWSATATAAFNFDKAEYDLPITSAGGVVTYIAEGDVTLKKRVTQ